MGSKVEHLILSRAVTGYVCLTNIVVPQTGRVLAQANEVISQDTAIQIVIHPSVWKDMTYGWQLGTVLQKSQAAGTGLLDLEGNLY